MHISIFAARKTQREYAIKLSKFISSGSDNKPSVLWHKDLLKLKHWVMAPFTFIPSGVSRAVVEVVKEKKNNPKYRQSKATYWVVFKFIKFMESRLLYTIYKDQFSDKNIDQLIIWNGLKFRQRIAVVAAEKLNIPCHYIERGAFPGTTTLDSKGINYRNSVPRDPEYYMAREVKDYSINLTCENKRSIVLPDDYIFIPFQVNIDSQITMFSPWINDMFSLVDMLLDVELKLGDAMPNIVLKSHPSCEQCYEELFDEIKKLSNKIHVVNNVETSVLIRDSKAIITINSSVGMEALLMRKKVIVLGQAFYNIKGITLSSGSIDELIENIKRVTFWAPSENLLSSFLEYLKYEYIVKGCWHEPDVEHFQSMTKKLDLLMSA